MKNKKEKEKEKEKEEDRYFNLLCDLEDALEDEFNEEEMDILRGEFQALLDEWEIIWEIIL